MATDTFRGPRTPEALVHRPWFDRAVRLGYAARALLYGVIAVTAMSVGVGGGGDPKGSQGALRTLARQPFGTALLVAIAVGLGGYALWRLIQAFAQRGDGWKERVFAPLAYGVRGVLYGTLCWQAVRLVTSGGGGGGGTNRRALTAQVLDLPGGSALLVAVAVVIGGYGLYQGYRAVSRRFEDDLRTGAMSRTERRWVVLAGITGHLGRMIVFGAIGYYLARAALTRDPDEVVGLDGALARLAGTGYGPWVLWVVGLLLLGFAVFSAAEAKHRTIRVQG